MKTVDVTLAIATYNSSPFLGELFASLRQQSVRPMRVIFSDDGSTDDTVARLERFAVDASDWDVRVHVNPKNLGIAGNYNALVALAEGSRWIQILDADDALMGDYYAALKPVLDRAPADLALVITSMRTGINTIDTLVRAQELALALLGTSSVPAWMQILGSLCTRSSLLYDAQQLKATPFVNPGFDGSDIIHMRRFIAKNAFVPAAQVFYRIHGGSATSQKTPDLTPYQRFLTTLPLRERLSYGLDFLLRKRAGAWLRRTPSKSSTP